MTMRATHTPDPAAGRTPTRPLAGCGGHTPASRGGWTPRRWSALAAGAVLAVGTAWAQAPAPTPAAPAAQKVVVSGTVPDEATRIGILSRVREVYGADRVVDQLGVGPLGAPPHWNEQVQKLLTSDLKRVSQGQLRIEGNVVEIVGSVDSAQTQAQIVRGLTTRLDNPTYTVRDALRVSGGGQQALDTAMANRIVEFETGNATLTLEGQRVLDDLLPVLRTLQGRRFEIVGHTDSEGGRAQNLVLSAARAESVKAYLVQRGIPEGALSTSGLGPDRPVADNATPQGRARNRRIEFRVLA
jgi:OOP family OmpA-OmpF porin